MLGQVQWTNNQHTAALDSYRQSVSLLKDHDPYETARTQLAWGRALLDIDRDRAAALLRESHNTFERMGAQRDMAALDDFE